MNKFLVLLLVVLFAFPALAQHRPGNGRSGYGHGDNGRGDYGHGDNGRGDYGHGDYGRGDHGRGDYGRGDYGRGDHGRGDYRRPGNGRPSTGRSCSVAMVNRRGRVIDTYFGYNDYYSNGCASAIQQCRHEIRHRNMFANRCELSY
ncbi:MAG TPA: hypothetical protein VNJ01_03350 [Bacteriovoracaceae bacterium]|nr:hypothetical protein [Bacteriovoracaceae bacterium]